MQFSDLLASRNLKFKILLVFSVILVIPLAFLMIVSLNRTSRVALHDFNLRLGYAASLFRRALEDQLDSIKIKNKKVADFEFYTLATREFPATETVNLMDTELIRSDLDFLAIVTNRRDIVIDRGSPPVEALDKIIPAMCHSPLNVNLYIIEGEPWIFSAAMITKIRSDEARHIVFAQRIPRDFADRLKRLTGAEFSLLFAGQKILTSQMDVYGKRRIGVQQEDPDKTSGSTLILGKSHFFVREVAMPGKLSESIRLEIALPDSEYNLLGRSIRQDFIFFGLFGLLLALITGTILALNIAGPINQLALKTSEIASGDLSVIPETNRKDEIGLLFRNFSEMITRLRAEKELKEQRMQELNTLFKIS
ncbi:MAG: HAMP domain-containing protein, partial [Candidatus Riflebacteria bacterium]